MGNVLDVSLEDGKYRVIQDESGVLKATRHGAEWRDCCGDGLIYSLASEVDNLRKQLDETEYKLAETRDELISWTRGNQ